MTLDSTFSASKASSSMDSDEPEYLPDVPPAYERGAFQLPADFVEKNAAIGEDGRIDLDFDSKLGRALASIVPHPPPYIPRYSFLERRDWRIKLNIALQVVGSRGDVQPFIALGRELQKHGHRVRLATHNVFEDFVRTSGLEFYPIGGDPAELMAYMVRNPGLIPGIRSLRAGDVQRKRAMVAEMLDGCWRSCVEPDMNSGAPFVAEAIIANPPSFAHIHCAQALGIPVHLVSTMPWTSTRAFPHPLANLRYTSTDAAFANYISYGIMEFLTWQGLGDLINKWRHSLDLDDVPLTEGPGLAETLKIPFTYCWSPALIPKPVDWPAHMDVCGFFFREPPNYTPPPELDAFLRAGPPPVYIGFGSIVIDDPGRMSATVLGAVRLAGVRAIISRGWSKLDGPLLPDVLYLGDCPHEWLFQHVAAVVHHGGAGTTACGLRNGKPTVIVPFFGDQPFWANMVAAAGAGPKPVPHKKLGVKALATAIAFCFTPEVVTAARTIAGKMQSESGVKAAVDSFHANLPLDRLECDILPDRPAAWKIQNGQRKARLSKLAAEVLVNNSKIDRKALKIYQTKKIRIDYRRWDPITGGSSAVTATITEMVDATAGIVLKPYQELRRSRANAPVTPGASTSKDDKGEGSSKGILAAKSSPTVRTQHEQDDMDERASGQRHSTSSTAVSTTQSLGGKDEDGPSSSAVAAPSSDISIPVRSPGRLKKNPIRKEAGASVPSENDMSTPARTPGRLRKSPFGKRGKGESSNSDTTIARRSAVSTAGAMVAASGKSMGTIITSGLRGTAVDIPVAFQEGLRNVPKMYGEEVKDYGHVKDWKSGMLVAGKTLLFGLPEGLADLVVQPYKGARADGVTGFAKGVGKGTMDALVKTSAATAGLAVYPVQGMYKSFRASIYDKTVKAITKARQDEGRWLSLSDHGYSPARIIAAYDGLQRDKGKGRKTASNPQTFSVYEDEASGEEAPPDPPPKDTTDSKKTLEYPDDRAQ
ncbi:Glycosyltransferase family 1 protein [Mycena sanguinolenta]|uniref:Glycosyltransferase family 1 protein n=1 Tax=Mycena sanguinolenta TaxID=230812 RepID=A0A8H7DNI8_9AGAR|nr:Glycosyltransferase family 1 protein [Mycena sanguinolenta]